MWFENLMGSLLSTGRLTLKDSTLFALRSLAPTLTCHHMQLLHSPLTPAPAAQDQATIPPDNSATYATCSTIAIIAAIAVVGAILALLMLKKR